MILNRIRKTIDEYNLLEKEDKILIAYSGGIDSTSLLLLFLDLREEMGLELFLGHFNHKLRSSADEDERFVKKMAQTYSLPLFVGSKEVRSYAKKHRLNLEEAGRKLRYDFLKKIALKIGATKIATGHTMNDQTETFFMRLMRGSGLRGLSGIFPAVEKVIIRPLIQVKREDIEFFLKKKKVDFRVDESNFDRRFLRNRIRLDLIPYIQKDFNPEIVTLVERFVSLLQAEEDFLEKMTEKEAAKAILGGNGQIQLDLRLLLAMPRAMARRIVRAFIVKLKGDLRDISFQDVESILDLGQGKEIHLRKNLVLRREQDKIFLKSKAPANVPYEYPWLGDRFLEIKEIRIRIEGKKRKMDRFPLDFNDQARAFLDYEKLKFPLNVRNRREGDRYRPLGSPGRKKLKEIMRAKRIPSAERETRPVFLIKDKIVWILGLPVAEKYKVDPETRDVFEISVFPLK